jgi:hypothetical protein
MSDSTTTSQRTVRLSKVDLTYLTNAKFLPEDLERIVSTAEASDNEERVLKLDRNTAERFRDEFTNRLARVGFGPDYEPTREGKLLEDLIDRFAK